MATVTVIEVRSQTDARRTYSVYVGEDGPVFCSCPAFRLHKGRVETRPACKHMREVAPLEETAREIVRVVRAGAVVSAVPGFDRSRFAFVEVVEFEPSTGARAIGVDLRRINQLEVD